MQIQWNNILMLVLVITLLVLLANLSPILRTLSEVFSIHFRGDADPAVAIMALGLLCVTVVAIFRMLSDKQ